MSVKEKPLIDAVEKLGPLPGFLFSNMVLAGLFSVLMCAVFCGVFMMFQFFGRGVADAGALFEATRWGARLGVGLGMFIHLIIAGRAVMLDDPDEKQVRMRFVYGGALGVLTYFLLDILAFDALRDWVSKAGLLVG